MGLAGVNFGLFYFMTGQIDIFFLWLARRIPTRGWKAVLLGALLTLKPLIAFIVLPWFLLQWVIHDRKTLLQWMLVTTALQLSPPLVDLFIYQKWLASIQAQKTGPCSPVRGYSPFPTGIYLCSCSVQSPSQSRF
jgi:hypothetical protein